MSARAFFFTRIQDDASGAGYERWALDVDYPFTRRQPAVGRYEILRVEPAPLGTQPPWEYAELIEVNDADTFPQVFEQDEAKPIIKTLRTFISPDPLGLVGTQVFAAPGEAPRSPHRAIVAVRLASGVSGSDYGTHAAEIAQTLLADPEISRVEIVTISGRYKRDEPAPVEYLVILDLVDIEALPAAAEALLAPEIVDPSGSFALVGALIEHLDQTA